MIVFAVILVWLAVTLYALYAARSLWRDYARWRSRPESPRPSAPAGLGIPVVLCAAAAAIADVSGDTQSTQAALTLAAVIAAGGAVTWLINRAGQAAIRRIQVRNDP